MITYVKAIYTGEADGLVKGNQYNLQLKQTTLGKTIVARPCHTLDWKPYIGYTQYYPTLHHFLHNWQIDSLEHPNATINGFIKVVEAPDGYGA